MFAGMPAARAEQPAKLPTIGYLGPATLDSQRLAAFVKRLRDLGWIEGRTIAIEYRWSEGRNERLAETAAELVRLKMDVIVTSATPPSVAVKQATSAIPIVFAAVADPVGAGVVKSLARPGGNATGLSLQQSDAAGKRIELLREVVPQFAPIGDHVQRRQSLGYARGAGSDPRARPGSGYIGHPTSRGHHTCIRRAQRPRRSNLRL